MFKKVIALSTAAMILLTPMSASAVTWEEVTDSLKSKNSYTDGKLTATRDGNDYTFTGGELEEVYISSYYLDANGKIYFNGVQMDELDIYADEGKYYVVLDKDTKADTIYLVTNQNGEAKLVNEGTIGRGEVTGIIINKNGHLTNKGTLKTGEERYYPTIDCDYRKDEYQVISNVSACAWDHVKNGTQEEAEKLVDRMFSFETPGTYNVIVTLNWEDENGEPH